MNGNSTPIWDLCDLLLSWTRVIIGRKNDNGQLLHEFSPEVYDRAVSVIGIVVPVGLFIFTLVCLFMFLFTFLRFIGGGKRK